MYAYSDNEPEQEDSDINKYIEMQECNETRMDVIENKCFRTKEYRHSQRELAIKRRRKIMDIHAMDVRGNKDRTTVPSKSFRHGAAHDPCAMHRYERHSNRRCDMTANELRNLSRAEEAKKELCEYGETVVSKCANTSVDNRNWLELKAQQKEEDYYWGDDLDGDERLFNYSSIAESKHYAS